MIALLQGPDGFDLRELFERAIQVVLFLIFIGLPILRGLIESARKSRERKAADGGAGRGEREAAEAEARRRWEELLRGEVAEASLPAPERPAEPPRAPRTLAAEPPQPPLVVIDALPGEPERRLESALEDEERTALEDVERRLQEERRRREDFARLERDAAATRRPGVEPEYVPAFELDVARPVEVAAVGRRARRPGALAALHAGGLRSAVIASEVLGRPLALRGEGGGPFDRPT